MAEFTKKAIKDSFIKLLNEKALKQITVRDIVEECQINRNTFYYHFEDIPTLLGTIIKEDADNIVNKFPVIDSIENCIEAAISFANQNRRAVLHIYKSVNRDLYEQYEWQVCDYVARNYIELITRDLNISEEDIELIISYTKCVVFGLTIYWLENDMNEEIKDSLFKLCKLKQGDLEQTIKRCIID